MCANLLGDGLLNAVMGSGGVIHPTVEEILDAREEMELAEAIAMSLASIESRSLSDLSSPSQLQMAKAPPPRLNRYPSEESFRERPAMISMARPPTEAVPNPPDSEPTRTQREMAAARIAALPTLFPPTGHAWMRSPLAMAKAPPPPAPLPEYRSIPTVERWFYFPTISHDPLIRRVNLASHSATEADSEGDSSEDADHDATSTYSTAPSLSPDDWD